MNNTQNYDGWMLCPSKRFPGKFYYFNVLNGDAAWSLADIEKNFVDKEGSIADKSHCYPEPQSPPIAECQSRNMCYQHQKPNFNYSGKIFANKKSTSSEPVFGKVVFPKYVSNVVQCTPNIIWEVNKISQSHNYKEDKATQTFLYNRDIFTQTNDKFSCCFNKYDGKTVNTFFTSPPPIKKHTQIFNHNMTNVSTFRGTNDYNLTAQRDINKAPIIRDSQLAIKQVDRVFSQNMMNFSSYRDKNDCNIKAQRVTIEEPTIKDVPKNYLPTFETLARSVNNRLKPAFITFVKSSDLSVNKNDTDQYLIHESKATQSFNPKMSGFPNMFKTSEEKVTITENHSLQNNTEKDDKNNTSSGTVDLRVVLNAKKRKNSPDNNVTGNTGGKKIKTTYGIPKTTTLKKRISFKDLDYDDRIISDERKNEDNQDNSTLAQEVPKLPIMQSLRMLAKRTMKNDIWYIAVDTTVLLEDFEFISAFVKRDVTCRLLITRAVRSDIEALSAGDSCGQQRVFVARQIVRKLLNPPPHFVLQPPLENNESYNNISIDYLLICCLRVIAENFHLVLVTNDSKLLAKAKSIDIPCLKLQDIKDAIPVRQVNFDRNNISKTVENAQINTNDRQSYSNNCSEIPINVYKKVLFGDRIESKMVNIQNSQHMEAEENDSIMSDIGHDIELLGIKETKNQYNQKLHPNKNAKEAILNKKQSELQNTFGFRTVFSQDTENLKNKTWPLTNKGTQTQFSPQNDIDNNHFDLNKIDKNIDENFNRKDKPNNNKSEHTKHNNRPLNYQNDFANLHKSTNRRLSDSDKIFLNEVSVKDYLEKFSMKYKVIENKIKSRINEWLCFYRQIMEDVLSDVLQKRPPYISTPLTLLEAIERIGQEYKEHTILVSITKKLYNIINPYVEENGNFRSDVEPSDFMCMFAYSLLLLKNLKIILPQCADLVEGEQLLEAVLQKMEHQTPERVLPHSAEDINMHDTDMYRQNFTQERELGTEYSAKYNSQYNPDEEMRDVDNCLPIQRHHNLSGNNKTIVFRTFGKHLKRLEIDKEKSLTITKDGQKTKKDSYIKYNSDNITLVGKENCDGKLNTDMKNSEQKDIRMFEDIKPFTQKVLNKNERNDNKVVPLKPNETKSNSVKINLSNNKIMKHIKENDTKELSNVKGLDNFDSNNKEVNDNVSAICDNDFESDRHDLKDKVDKAISERKSITDCGITSRGIIKPQNTGMNRDVLDDNTNDSGVDMEGTQAYSLGKLFMCELATSFHKIFQFINESLNEICDEKLTEARKVYFHKISDGLLKHLNGVIEKLRRITDRESNDSTSAKSLILKAGFVASTDKRITNYRQVVKKCIEQALYLQKALKLTLNVTDRNFECLSTADTESISESIQYLNIFE